MAVLVYDDLTYKSATVPPGVRISDLHRSGDVSTTRHIIYRLLTL